MKKYDVFISHKSQDKNALTKIERFLTQNNITWQSDSKLQPGLDWTKPIDQAISKEEYLNIYDDFGKLKEKKRLFIMTVLLQKSQYLKEMPQLIWNTLDGTLL